jgi:hypothetical protein
MKIGDSALSFELVPTNNKKISKLDSWFKSL